MIKSKMADKPHKSKKSGNLEKPKKIKNIDKMDPLERAKGRIPDYESPSEDDIVVTKGKPVEE